MQDPNELDPNFHTYHPQVQEMILRAMAMAEEAKKNPPPSKKYSCEKCKDTTFIFDGRIAVGRCECYHRDLMMRRIRRSGLEHAIEHQTFERFEAREEWQRKAKDSVMAWTEKVLAGERPWLYCGGAVGSGKTHLCTAACGKLLKAGMEVRYMLWPEESRQLRARITDSEAYDELCRPLQEAEVLYIDDLFKTERGARLGDIRTPEIRVAFELIDARYRARKPTIISSEWYLSELVEFDEGTFTRVYQLARGHLVQIARGKGRNMRLDG